MQRSLYLAFCFLPLATSAMAQVQVQMQKVQLQPNAPGPFDSDPVELEAAMRIEVDTIRRVTGLTDAAAKKLEVAAMAALKLAIKKSQVVDDARNGNNLESPSGQPATTLSDEDSERQNLANKTTPDQPVLAMPGLDIQKVKAEVIWTKTLASTLNREQLAKYEAYVAERLANRRLSAVETKVNELDDCLSFTADQRKRVTEMVDRKLGHLLVNQPRAGGAFGGGQIIVFRGGQPPVELEADDLKPLLSDVQLAEFKRRQELGAQGPLGAMGRMLPPAIQAQLGLNPPAESSLGFTYAEKEQGIEILSVEEQSEAADVGLQVGDIIEEIGGTPIDTAVQMKRASNKRVRPLTLRVQRAGKSMDLGQGEAK